MEQPVKAPRRGAQVIPERQVTQSLAKSVTEIRNPPKSTEVHIHGRHYSQF